MTIIDEKEILEIEALKAQSKKVFHDAQMDMKKFDIEQKRFEVEQKKFEVEQKQYDKNFEMKTKKMFYESLRLAFYGVAVGAGGTFAIAKTLQLLGASA